MPPKTQPARKNPIKRASSSTVNDEVNDDKAEPYHCKGKFLEDFDALCRQAQISYIVPVVQRPHPPTAVPVAAPVTAEPKEKAPAKPTKGASQAAAPNKDRELLAQQHSEIDSADTSPEDLLPKTYALKDNQEYFKPKIQVEMEHPDKQETITEILIRAWKIDRAILDIFALTLPTLDRLHTLHFWHTGFTDETLKHLASILPKCVNVRTLILDANPLPYQHYDILFTDDALPMINLSLRHCRITERGAARIAQGLGNERRQNKKLQSLNLAYNSIGDEGAEHIAASLKFNRSLLVLNLSSNDIGDVGAEKLAEVLSKFPLTEEELVHRRKLLLQSSVTDGSAHLPSARRGGDRRTSMNSSPTAAGRKKSGVTSTTAPSKGKPGTTANANKNDGKDTAKAPKKDDKVAKKGATIAESKPSKATGKPGMDKLGKTTGMNKAANSMPGNRSATLSETDPMIGDGIPLLDQNAELIKEDLFLPGNKCLLSLNLTKNRISDTGVQYFLRALQYQETFIKLNISTRNQSSTSTTTAPSQGLLRLELQRNDFVLGENEAYEKIRHLLGKRREPIFKSKDNADEASMGGRDTVGTPHSRSRTGMRH